MMNTGSARRIITSTATAAMMIAMAGCGGDSSEPGGAGTDPDPAATTAAGAPGGDVPAGTPAGTVTVDGQTYDLTDISQCDIDKNAEGEIQVEAWTADRKVFVMLSVFSGDLSSLNGLNVDVTGADGKEKEWTTGYGTLETLDVSVSGSEVSATATLKRAAIPSDPDPRETGASVRVTC